VIDEEEFMDIRALHRQGLTYAEIGRLVGRDWRTVKRYLVEGAQPVYRRRRAPSMLDPLKPVVDQWLARDPRLLVTRIHQDLARDYGFEGSYQTVRRYVERSRPRPHPELERQRVHGTHGEVVAVRAERDRAALLALPPEPYLVVERTQRTVARDGLFSFEGRRYRAPAARPGERVELVLGADELEV
jgi:hypothetical protein